MECSIKDAQLLAEVFIGTGVGEPAGDGANGQAALEEIVAWSNGQIEENWQNCTPMQVIAAYFATHLEGKVWIEDSPLARQVLGRG